MEDVQAIRAEAERLRATHREDETDPLFVPFARPGVDGGESRQAVRTAAVVWIVLTVLGAAVGGTVAASAWARSAIKDRVTPVERLVEMNADSTNRKLERIEDKLDRLIEREMDHAD